MPVSASPKAFSAHASASSSSTPTRCRPVDGGWYAWACRACTDEHARTHVRARTRLQTDRQADMLARTHARAHTCARACTHARLRNQACRCTQGQTSTRCAGVDGCCSSRVLMSTRYAHWRERPASPIERRGKGGAHRRRCPVCLLHTRTRLGSNRAWAGHRTRYALGTRGSH